MSTVSRRSSSAPARPGSPPRPCSPSTASSAWSWTGGSRSIRSRARSHLDDEVYRILARLGLARRVRRDLPALPGLRLVDRNMRVLAEFRRGHRPGPARLPPGEHVRPAGTGGAPARQPHAGTPPSPSGATPRSPTSPRTAPDRCGSRSPTGRPARRRPSPPSTCSGCDGANSLVRAAIGAIMRDLQLRAALARRRRRDRRRPRPVGGRAPGLRPGPRRHLHAGRADPLPLGVPAGRPARPPTTTATSPGCIRCIAPWTGGLPVDRLEIVPGGRVHLPRPGRRPLARPAGVPARRRRPPHPAVHRPGHGRRHARRGQPRLEARRRARRRAARRPSWTPTRPNASPTPAR